MDAYRRFINRDLPPEERSCSSKVQHLTRREARSAARDGHRGDGSLRPYHCRFGEHWHLGHRRCRHRLPASEVAREAAQELPRSLPADDRPAWMSREWWADRRRRHLRPPRLDCPWREAWAVG